jgi:hypothetical protein
MPGYTASLNATGTQLQLTAIITDVTPPVPGTGVFGTATVETANLNWTAATDNQTPTNQLRYYVYQSSSNNITTVANCEANGTLLNAGGSIDITEYSVSDLTPDQTYYFNVVVADMANNKAAYTPKQLSTGSEAKIISVTIAPKTATVTVGNTQQFTATVVAQGGADETVMWLVEGHVSSLTTVTPTGLLTVAEGETATTITVKAISNFNPEIFDNATVTIVEDVIPPTITTATLPDGAIDIDYFKQLEATGSQPITWAIANGNLPTGLTLSENGVISGTPTAEGNFEFTVKAQNAAGSTEQKLSIKIWDEVGIEQLTMDNGQLKIYPNPVSGQLTIDNGELTMENVKIYDVMGRIVNNCQLSTVNCQLKINVEFLPPGVYFLRIGNKTAKFIKN